MYKELRFQTQNEKGVFLYTIGEGRDHGFLTKTASASLHPEIQKYIDNAQPIPGKTQTLLTALGAGEYWGSNINGDIFPQDGLRHHGKDYGYKTFEYYAKVYKHHVNKDPEKSYGDVILAVWNERMKRVELIVTIDHAKAPDLIERIENGEYPEVSMGCKVPYDECTCCGNKAKTRAQYCDHLRYFMNKIPPGYSKKASAINHQPKFFDISFVLVGADRIASVLRKVAHVPNGVVSSAELGAQTYQTFSHKGLEKVAFGLTRTKVATRKLAEIEKEVPSNTEPNTVRNLAELGSRGSELLRSYEPEIPKHIIIRITSSGSPGPGLLNKILSTLSMSGVMPRPKEFQSIVLRSLGKNDLADNFEQSGMTFDPCSCVEKEKENSLSNMLDLGPQNFDDDILSSIQPILADRSYSRPLLGNRIIRLLKMAEAGTLPPMKKTAEDDREPLPMLPVMAALTGLYLAFGKKSPEAMGQVEGFIHKHPLLATALGASIIGTSKAVGAMTGRSVKGKFDFNPDNAPMPHLSWQDRINQMNANPIAKTAKISLPVKIFAGVPALYMLSGMQEVKRARNPYEPEGVISKTLRKYPDLLSAALVGSHFIKTPKLFKGAQAKSFSEDIFLKQSGVGTPIKARNQHSVQKNSSENFAKTGEISDDMKSNLIYTLAFPGKSMALRGASIVTDMGILSGLEKLYARMSKKSGGNNDNY